MQINFSSFKNSEETSTWHAKSHNIEIMMGSETDDIINGLFESLLQRHQKGLEASEKKESSFIFDSVNLLHYHLHKTSLRRGKSYIKSPELLKNKRATINPKNIDDNCFQYALTVALDDDKIEKHPERISNIKPFIDQYNLEGIDFPSHEKDWRRFE